MLTFCYDAIQGVYPMTTRAVTPERRSEIARGAALARWAALWARARAAAAVDEPVQPACLRCGKRLTFERGRAVPGKGWFCVRCIWSLWLAERRELKRQQR